jgi:hypothetical protein
VVDRQCVIMKREIFEQGITRAIPCDMPMLAGQGRRDQQRTDRSVLRRG